MTRIHEDGYEMKAVPHSSELGMRSHKADPAHAIISVAYQDNLVGKDTLPIDMMRCKLAFFGASRFDPRSDKWVRISLFQDMPFPYQLV